MSENSDLRERAREVLTRLDTWSYVDGINVATQVVYDAEDIIQNLLKALDATEREERERCAYLSEKHGCWTFDCGDKIAAAIRREGGK